MLLASGFALIETKRSTATFKRCAFDEYHADFYGQVAYSSISPLQLVDSHIAKSSGGSLSTGTVFDFGMASDCESGCGPGEYGSCEKVRHENSR